MMQQTKSLYLAAVDVPGWLREHGASRHAGRDALSPEYPKPTCVAEHGER